MKEIKRAITFAGGGPAVGLSIGLLKRLEENPEIKFDVWSSACIGAWLTVAYQQADEGKELEQTIDFFKQLFRPDATYERFPVASCFAPNFLEDMNNLVGYMTNPASYQGLIVPEAIQDAAEFAMGYLTDPKQWNVANFNSFLLNGLMAANPFARFMMGALYQTPTKGMATIYYPDSKFLNDLKFERLYDEGKPAIYHNAYNLTRQRLELFTNRPLQFNLPKMTRETLCACSALPYIETPVKIGGDTYCEGATVDTVNFEDLMRYHPDLDEVWVSRILDLHQIRRPENLYDALNNLVMLFAASTSEDDVRLFKHHIKDKGYDVKVIEVPVAANINYDWNYSNLERSINDGYAAADYTIKQYLKGEYVTLNDVKDASPKSAANAAE
ncbi:patatin-like phospholipase family protein [Terasakiella sp. SH-1]|uniref:patatin-like phospholipase family protein n=1 Tax=Terasakiella sp. SH-1 TaxID=2560057 RepID=UPI001073AE8E|nr:patatin-like phospholipase family protein [Terasakiella sp. SH-1]